MAALVHADDRKPGIRRKRQGRGFTYIVPGGKPVCDEETLTRIRSLAIPPAWRDVWISPVAEGHLQASGRDARGRKQYRYHPAWTACRDAAKFADLAAFARKLPLIRARVDADLRRHGVPRERVLAAAVRLLDLLPFRVGNSSYYRENDSVGLTTLRQRNLDHDGASLRFSFTGKSGRGWVLRLSDRRVARAIARIEDLPGQQLLQYLDEAGEARPIQSQDVNDYIREASGGDITSKYFRTWAGSVMAFHELSELGARPAQDREATLLMNRAIDRVARELHNSRTVCRQNYIHPALLESWGSGQLPAEVAALRRRYRRPLAGLSIAETHLLHWLEDRKAA